MKTLPLSVALYLAPIAAIAQTASIDGTVYVTTSGSDANTCLSWTTACATVQEAISKLPAKGGSVQVGYGQFACFTLTNLGKGGITIQGRGIGPLYNSSEALTANTDATQFVNRQASVDCITISGSNAYNYPQAIVLQDFAVYGAPSTRDGINIIGAPNLTIRNVKSYGNGRHGLSITNSYWVELNTVESYSNGSDGLNEGSAVNAQFVHDSQFNFNSGNGAVVSSGNATTFVNTDFSANGKNGSVASNGGPYTWIGCFFFKNSQASPGVYAGLTNDAGGGQYTVIGSFFTGNDTQGYGINPNGGPSDIWRIMGNEFLSHTHWSIENYEKPEAIFEGNRSTDTTFLHDYDGSNTASSGPSIAGSQAYRTFNNRLLNTQALSRDGDVTIDASAGQQIQAITLSANATSSSITNPLGGQIMTIEWIQDAKGSRAYVWPSNCKFAGGMAPSASRMAGHRDSVTFRYDYASTSWIEVSRSIGIP